MFSHWNQLETLCLFAFFPRDEIGIVHYLLGIVPAFRTSWLRNERIRIIIRHHLYKTTYLPHPNMLSWDETWFKGWILLLILEEYSNCNRKGRIPETKTARVRFPLTDFHPPSIYYKCSKESNRLYIGRIQHSLIELVALVSIDSYNTFIL